MSEIIKVDVEDLTPHPANPRRGDVPAIMRSLERFGQVKPIIVQRSTSYVVAGNHTLQAAERLGWNTVEVQVVDMDDETATAYLLADNALSDKASYDKNALFDLLGSAMEQLDGTGWTEEDVAELADELGEYPEFGDDDDSDPVKKGKENYDPMREIVVMVPVSEFGDFTKQLAALQEYWGFRTTVEAIRKVIEIAYDNLPTPEKGFQQKPAKADF